MAVSFVISWQPGLDLEILAAHQEGMEVELVATAEPRAAPARNIASYVEWNVYVLERAFDNAPLLEHEYALALGDSDGSSDETGSNETGSSADMYSPTWGVNFRLCKTLRSWACCFIVIYACTFLNNLCMLNHRSLLSPYLFLCHSSSVFGPASRTAGSRSATTMGPWPLAKAAQYLGSGDLSLGRAREGPSGGEARARGGRPPWTPFVCERL